MELKNCSMVLEGGAIKGVFTAGALDYLMEKDFYPEYVVGVSAGACNAVDYVSRQPGRTRDCFITTGKDEKYLKFSNFFHGKPIYDMDLVFDEFPERLHPFDFDTFYASDMKCEMVVTNCVTGKAEYLTASKDPKEFMKACRASSSMPMVSPIVVLNHRAYMDGGIADSVPLRHAMEKGYEKQIVILTKNAGYRKEPSRLMYRMCLKKYARFPKLCEAVRTRYIHYNETMEYLEKLEKEGKIFVLRPRMKAISRMEQDHRKTLAFYQDGYDLMKEEYDRMMDYLER